MKQETVENINFIISCVKKETEGFGSWRTTDSGSEKSDMSAVTPWLIESPEVGTIEFFETLFLKLNEIHRTDSAWVSYKELSRALCENKNMTREVYEFIGSSEPEFAYNANYLRGMLRGGIYFNDVGVAYVQELGALSRFRTNENGEAEWLKTVKELRGNRFFDSTHDFVPFIQKGVIGMDDIVIKGEVSPEIVSKLAQSNMESIPPEYAHLVVSNLSRRFIRHKRFGHYEKGGFLQNKKLNKSVFDKYGVNIYDLLLERLIELVPSTQGATPTARVVVISASSYFLSESQSIAAGSAAAYRFYKTYESDSSVSSSYENYINRISDNQPELQRFAANVMDVDESEYDGLPASWLLKLLQSL